MIPAVFTKSLPSFASGFTRTCPSHLRQESEGLIRLLHGSFVSENVSFELFVSQYKSSTMFYETLGVWGRETHRVCYVNSHAADDTFLLNLTTVVILEYFPTTLQVDFFFQL